MDIKIMTLNINKQKVLKVLFFGTLPCVLAAFFAGQSAI